MSNRLKENMDRELEQFNFDVDVEVFENKYKVYRKRKNNIFMALICVCIASVIFVVGVMMKPINNLVYLDGSLKGTENVTEVPKTNFTLFACVAERSETEELFAEKYKLSNDRIVTVEKHRIHITEHENNGRIYYYFHIGDSSQREGENDVAIVERTRPLIYISGEGIESVKAISDNAYIDALYSRDYIEDKSIVQFDFDKKNPENNAINCLLPREFLTLVNKCNETDYKFDFTDIPQTTIKIYITTDDGEVQKKTVKTYYNEQGYFCVKECSE